MVFLGFSYDHWDFRNLFHQVLAHQDAPIVGWIAYGTLAVLGSDCDHIELTDAEDLCKLRMYIYIYIYL